MGTFDQFRLGGDDPDFSPSASPRETQPRGTFDRFRLAPDAVDVPEVDFNRPIEEVRADLAKIPEGPARDAVMKKWADAYVAKERGTASQAQQKPDDTSWLGPVGWGPNGPAVRGPNLPDVVRNVARGSSPGLLPLGAFADEMNAGTSAIIHKITGGRAGSPYDEALAYQHALDRAIDKESPTGSAAAQLAGGLVSGGAAAKFVYDQAKKIAPKALAAPAAGAIVGPTIGYGSALGEAEGDLGQRHDRATSGEDRLFGLSPPALGLAAGVGLPPAISSIGYAGNKLADVAGPVAARYAAQIKELPRRIGFPASADGAVPEGVGARAQAAQMLANSLRRSGKSIDDINAAREGAADAGVFHTSGQAQDATFLADLDQGWQRLAGSSARANPGAAEIGKSAIYARQTGITPHNGLAGNVADTVGLPTAPMFARPITAPQAIEKFGTDFGAGDKNVVPMGQGARIVDALKRAFRIKDTDFHGHAANANRTDDAILAAAKEAAQPAYNKLYRTGDNISIAPEVGGALTKWTPDGEKLAREAPPVVAMVQRYVKMFAPGGNATTHIERFDRIKQYLDGQIEKLFDSPIGRNRHAAGVLNDFKNDLLAAVDNIPTNGLGKLYSGTRREWSSAMEARDAIKAGREARSNPDAGLRSLAGYGDNEGHLKLFRLGILGDVENAIKNMKRGADKTTIFDNENIQRLLSEAIPRSQDDAARFATRPETFGRYVGNAQREVETRNFFQGGSPTQRNIKDDDAYDVLSRWGEMMQGFKSTGSLTKLGIDLVANTFHSMFGMRKDVAQSIVRQLFTADKAQQHAILSDIASRMEPAQFERLTRYVQEQQAALIATSTRQMARE